MPARRLAAIGLAAWLLASSAAAAQEARVPAAATALSPAFQAEITAAKSAMMADPKLAFGHATNALDLAQAAPAGQHDTATATAQWLQGEALIRMNQKAKAAPILAAALALIEKQAPNTKLHGDLMMAEGGMLATDGKVQEALGNFQRAHNIFRAAGEPRSQAIALQNIGTIYQDAGDFQRVLQYYAQSGETYAGDPALTLSAQNNTANAYRHQGKLKEAQAEYRKALATAEQMKSPLLQARILANLASADMLLGDLRAAEAEVQRGLALAGRDPVARTWAPFLWGVSAQTALKRGQVAVAEQRLQRTFAGVDVAATPPPFRDFHETAYQVYDQLGQTERALAHLKAFKRLDDEARNVTASTNAALMTARFDFTNQNLKIANLKAGQLQRDIQLARTRNTITQVLLGSAVLVLGLLLFGLISLRRSRNEVRAANVNLSAANTSLEKALKAKTEFLATTSHEIRTPLNGILGMTQVILADAKVDPAMRDKIVLVHGAGETMRALVDDILDVAKIETGNLSIERTEIDLSRVLEETVRLWTEKAVGKGLAMTVDICQAPARIVEDAARLRQILFNLMSNAIKFTDEGEVGIVARVQAAADGGERLVLQVTDTGVGIPADQFEEAFESFKQLDGGVTRRHSGTGLGLTICRNLARALGGEITVESTVGKGSIFTLDLPLVRGADAMATPVGPGLAQDGPTVLPGSSVLLVEANLLTQSILRAVLQKEVRALEIVASKEAALATLAGRPFDLILADGGALILGDQDPFASAANLVDAARGAPVAVLWSQPSAEDMSRLMRAGVRQVLAKPMPTSNLVTALHALCGKDNDAVVGSCVDTPSEPSAIKSTLSA